MKVKTSSNDKKDSSGKTENGSKSSKKKVSWFSKQIMFKLIVLKNFISLKLEKFSNSKKWIRNKLFY